MPSVWINILYPKLVSCQHLVVVSHDSNVSSSSKWPWSASTGMRGSREKQLLLFFLSLRYFATRGLPSPSSTDSWRRPQLPKRRRAPGEKESSQRNWHPRWSKGPQLRGEGSPVKMLTKWLISTVMDLPTKFFEFELSKRVWVIEIKGLLKKHTYFETRLSKKSLSSVSSLRVQRVSSAL